MNITENNNTTDKDEKKPCPNENKRKRDKRKQRFYEGVRQLIVKPYKNIPILIWAISLCYVLSLTGTFTEHIMGYWLFNSIDRIFVFLFDATIMYEIIITLTVAIFFIILSGILRLTLKPPRADQIENDLAIAKARQKP